MACKARWVALLLACLLHDSALAQRSSSGGTASSGATRSSGTFRATAPPPPSARASSSGGSSNSGSGGFVTTLGTLPHHPHQGCILLAKACKPPELEQKIVDPNTGK